MRGAIRVACAALAVALIAWGARPTAAEDDEHNAIAAQKAVPAAQPVVAAARKAAKGDAETCKALKATRATLEPFFPQIRNAHKARAKEGTNAAFAMVWNDLMTVSEFHGVPGKPDYVLDPQEVLWSRYLLGLPIGSAWSWTYNTNPKDKDQLHMFVLQKRPNGEKLRYIKVWTYRWDTVYSGIGGENTKGMAKVMHELDRDSTAKSGRKVSPAVTAKRINAEFDRVYYYFVEGFDVDEEKRLRRDNYYMKGDNLSFNFEVITYLDPAKGDDDVTKWQSGEGDPEIKAVLESLVSNPNRKTSK